MKKNLLGQHFLRNKAILKKIASSLELKPGEIVIEIGAGHGELTDELRIANRESQITAIEKDPLLAEKLKKKFQDDNLTKIISGDALKILSSVRDEAKNQEFKIVGNIPYYITGHLLRKISESKQKPSLCIFMMQKEVAERICAQPPRMNRLAASVQFWANPEIIGQAPKENFSPRPKVDSAIIKLELKKINLKEENYYLTVKTIFAQPRKTLLNNIFSGNKRGLGKEKIMSELKKNGINPSCRPQDLRISDIIKIAGSEIF